MILIFGGAYQGKTEYAKSLKNIEKISDCSKGGEPDFSAECVCGIEGFVLECVRRGVEPKEWFAEREEQWNSDGKILVMTDTSQGVVPVEKDLRDAREANGRLMLYLASKATEVHRVFCGIGKKIK